VIDLESARAKITRGVEHYAALARACQDFTDSQPHEVTIDFEADVGCYVARFNVRKEPPHKLSLILGDLIHNARAALDHAAWQAACLCNSEQDLLRPGTRTLISFPITTHPNEFAKHSVLRFVPEAAKAVFEWAQPYHGPDGPEDHWLARLNRMWNADKHRLLHPTFALASVGKTGFVPRSIHIEDAGVEIESLIPQGGYGIEDGAKIAHIRFPGGPKPDAQGVDVKTQPPAHIVFGTGRDACGIWTIGTFCGTASLVLDRIEDALGGGVSTVNDQV
jgi:hypothetical protein